MTSAILISIIAIISGILLFVGAVLSVDAGHQGHTMFSADISRMDTNADGVVSLEEYEAFHTEQMRWSFNALDTDNDGNISKAEWETFLRMHGVGKSHRINRQG